MSYAPIDDALTVQVTIGRKNKRVVTLQEWPFTPGMRFFKLLRAAVTGVMQEYGGSSDGLESVRDLRIQRQKKNPDGTPMVKAVRTEDGVDTGETAPVMEMDIEFILRLLSSISGTLADKSDLLVDCIDAAMVTGSSQDITRTKLETMLFGDVFALFTAALKLNFSPESSLGESLSSLLGSAATAQQETPPQPSPTPHLSPLPSTTQAPMPPSAPTQPAPTPEETGPGLEPLPVPPA